VGKWLSAVLTLPYQMFFRKQKIEIMGQPKIKYQQFIFTVNAIGDVVPVDFETDKLYKKITGINVVLSDEKNKFSTLELSINNQELFPDKFEVLRLTFRDQVPFGYEYHELNEPASGSKVKGKYTDKNNGATYPYNVTISLKLENID
jgi:hypothetical protein